MLLNQIGKCEKQTKGEQIFKITSNRLNRSRENSPIKSKFKKILT